MYLGRANPAINKKMDYTIENDGICKNIILGTKSYYLQEDDEAGAGQQAISPNTRSKEGTCNRQVTQRCWCGDRHRVAACMSMQGLLSPSYTP
jgi:hypothetical protein